MVAAQRSRLAGDGPVRGVRGRPQARALSDGVPRGTQVRPARRDPRAKVTELEATQGRRSLPRRVLGRLRVLPVRIGYFHGPRLMSALRKRWILFRNPHVDIQFGK